MSSAGQAEEDRSLPRRVEYVAARIVILLTGLLPEPAAYFLADRLLALFLLFVPAFRNRLRAAGGSLAG